MSDAWYLPESEYYVPDSAAHEYPQRQGDIFAPPSDQSGWLACMLAHPTCELTKASLKRVQIIRIYSLDVVTDDSQKAAICAGWSEKDGRIQVAYANTFFLAPIPRIAGDTPLFADYRQIALADKEELRGRRLAALTHDARITYIRRELLFRFRYMFSFEEVKRWEASRISADHEFKGPRPAWADLATSQEVG